MLRSTGLVVVLLFLVVTAALASSPATHETAVVRQIPVTFTVHPVNEDAATCDLFDPRTGLRLTAAGKPRAVVGHELTVVDPFPAAPSSPADTPLAIVLLFDYWNMGFGTTCPWKDETQRVRYTSTAFDAARQLLRNGTRPGDRIMIARFVGYLRIDAGWLTDPAEALDVLDRVESEPVPLSAWDGRRIDDWFSAMELLATALSFYPGEKDVFVPLTAIPVGADEATELERYGRTLSDAGVRVHAVPMASGVEAFMPPGLRNITDASGAPYFCRSEPTLVDAVARTRLLSHCRITVFYAPDPAESTRRLRGAPVTIDIVDPRFRLVGPARTAWTRPARSGDERRNVAFLHLPGYEKGIRIETAVSPSGPSGKNGDWRALVVVRLSIIDAALRGTLHGVIVQSVGVVNGRKTSVEGEFTRFLDGAETAELNRTGTVTIAYEAKVAWGSTDLAAMAFELGMDVRSVAHHVLELPKAPGPWIQVSDRAVFADRDVKLVPSMSRDVAKTRQLLVRGYACTDNDHLEGRWVSDEVSVAAPIFKVDCSNEAKRTRSRCSCLLGFPENDLHPGRWTFEPPPELVSERRLTARIADREEKRGLRFDLVH